MLVLRFGKVHEDGCDELATTRDWVPLRDFSESALESVDLAHCPACLDGSVAETIAAEQSAAAPSLE